METVETSSEQIEKSDQILLDINKISQSVRAKLKSAHPFSNEYCCIYRIPERMRHVNEKVCTPQVVSIGPLHHGKKNLKSMEEHKIMYLQEFLGRSKVSMENLVTVIKESETRLRTSYAEIIELSSEEFVEMILLDAVFVIMFLLKCCDRDFRSSGDFIFTEQGMRRRMMDDIRLDMCLLENQLPFFILVDLLMLSNMVNYDKECSMIKLAKKFLRVTWGSWVKKGILEKLESGKINHFIDFLRICQQPSMPPPRKRFASLVLPSVTELHQAGVKFEISSSECLHDIKFNNGILEIPQLEIDDLTEILFRNLQAFEQCHCADNYINDYLAIISSLVHSPQDVEILVQNGIIKNDLPNSEAVSTLLYTIDKEIVFYKDFYFSALVEDLNKYCRRFWPKWKASLKQDYFNNPWATISVIAAAFLLILTIIQSVCSIIQVVSS